MRISSFTTYPSEGHKALERFPSIAQSSLSDSGLVGASLEDLCQYEVIFVALLGFAGLDYYSLQTGAAMPLTTLPISLFRGFYEQVQSLHVHSACSK